MIHVIYPIGDENVCNQILATLAEMSFNRDLLWLPYMCMYCLIMERPFDFYGGGGGKRDDILKKKIVRNGLRNKKIQDGSQEEKKARTRPVEAEKGKDRNIERAREI